MTLLSGTSFALAQATEMRGCRGEKVSVGTTHHVEVKNGRAYVEVVDLGRAERDLCERQRARRGEARVEARAGTERERNEARRKGGEKQGGGEGVQSQRLARRHDARPPISAKEREREREHAPLPSSRSVAAVLATWMRSSILTSAVTRRSSDSLPSL